jgi:putative hemolysin
MRVAVAMQQERRIDQQRHLSIERATRSNDIDAAKRLRYRVFAGELGARIQARRPGHDEDPFDAWCDHLVVRDQSTSEIVGTYRILTAERAKRFGTFYSEGEFDLTRLARLRPGIAEIGRACIREDYRSGAVIMLLWQGIAQYMREHGAGYLIGCASIGMADGGADAVRVYHQLAPRHLAPIEYRVFPRHPLMPRGGDKPAELAAPASIPSLLKGYLRVGAWIAGEPARDPELNTADLFVLLSLAHVDARYARHYLKAA